jgi:hypothetical protein
MTETKNIQEEFLSVVEVAELVKSTPKSIYTNLHLAKSGKSKGVYPKNTYIKVGRKVLFIKSRLMEWLLNGAKMEIIER